MNSAPTIATFMRQAARRYAERTCLVDGIRRWTFAEFTRACDCVAAGLVQQLDAGARVAVFLSNRAECLMLQVAIDRAGMVRVPVNARATVPDLRTLLEDCGATALFHDAATAGVAAASCTPASKLWQLAVDGDSCANGPPWADLAKTPPVSELLGRARLDDLGSINYTSGSSGRPKGVMLTHRNWLGVCRNMLIDRDIRGDDVLAHVGPLTHASGSYFAPWFLRGGCSLLVPGGTVEALLHAISRQGVSVFTCVPTFLTRLVNYPDIHNFDLSSLRAIGYGAEPIPQNTLHKALKLFGPILTQNFGLTEAMMTVTNLTPADHFVAGGESGSRELRIGCIGRPYSMVEVVVRAPDGSPVPEGESGELTVRSEHVMQGYWNMPEETAKVLRDGWLWSGDLARQDASGLITLVGRSKEMIISGGFNIYPQEVEATLTAHAQVIEAAVLGMPDADWGEAVVAFVAPVPGTSLDAQSLSDHCKPTLGIRTPKRFVFLDALPKNPNNKVDKRALKAMLIAQAATND